MRTPAVCLLLVLTLAAAARAATVPPSAAATRPFIAGADVSMLPEAEKAGATFRPGDGAGAAATADALDLLRDGGCNLVRVRLFVNPSTDAVHSYGATQD